MDDKQVLLRTFHDAYERQDDTNVVTISTGTVDRFGTILNPHGWDLKAYRKNPVVLWAHMRTELPIGVAKRVWVDGDRLKAEFEWVSGDLNPWAQQVKTFYDEKILKGFSVGFRVLESTPPESEGGPTTFKKLELLEFSAVPVPANPEALADSWEPLARMFDAARSVHMVQTGPGTFRAVSIDKDKESDDKRVERAVWDGVEAQKRVEAWAGGDAKKRAKAYALARGTELLLPHHDVAEAGNLVTSRAGVEEAISCLEIALLSDEECERAYDHLYVHADQFGIQVPEFEDVKSLRSRKWKLGEAIDSFEKRAISRDVFEHRLGRTDQEGKGMDNVAMSREDLDALTQAKGLIDQVLSRAPAKVEEPKVEEPKSDDDAGVIEITE